MSANTIKCVVSDYKSSSVFCTQGNPNETRKAQEALLASEFKTANPEHCEFILAGKIDVVVGYRRSTAEEKRVCRVQSMRERFFAIPGEDMCGMTAIVEQQNKYVLTCNGSKTTQQKKK